MRSFVRYTVKVAVASPEPNKSIVLSDVVESLQGAYLHNNIAGQFDVEVIGTIAIVTFTRNTADDEAVLKEKGVHLTPHTVLNQLAVEFKEYFGLKGYCGQVQQAFHTLDAKVDGLPCQAPTTRFVIDVSYDSEKDRDEHAELLGDEHAAIATLLGGTITSLNIVTKEVFDHAR